MLAVLIALLAPPPPAPPETPPPPVATPEPASPPPALAAPPAEGEAEEKAPWQRDGWGWGALPALNYNSDDGFGFGAIGDIYRYDGETRPYRADLGFLIFFTSKGSQYHRLNLDLLRVGGLPLRLTSRVQFQVTKVRNYCGLTPPGDCDEDIAEAAADDLGLSGDDRDEFVRRYYLVRVTDPYLSLNARYELTRLGPYKVEAFGGWFGQIVIPGDFDSDAPYPNSRYAQDFGGGEEGFLSVLQAGVMFDGRDNEPSPTAGTWLEASVRGAGPWIGSRDEWEYVGFNVTLRGYQTLGTDRLVLTDRLVFDGIFGDTYTGDLARAGGSQLYDFFGGQRAGRGIRASRVLGRARAMNQTELRATVWRPRPFGLQLDITPIAFFDIGYWAETFDDIGDEDKAAVVWGTGGGLRVAANQNFIVRFDLGFSPLEEWAPSIYLDLSNLW
ncbi:MAG: BamA/TamA family outer membrane protein [bacterium]